MIGEAGRSALGSRGQRDGLVGGLIGGLLGGIRCKSWTWAGGKKGWESQVNKRVKCKNVVAWTWRIK